MQSKLKGYLCGIGAAVCYGTNPLGALYLYEDGINANSVLFYRFALAVVMLGMLMAARRKSLKVSRRELSLLCALGVVFSTSSITLYFSFCFMDAGIASTLLFVYPVMVAVIMALLFKERLPAVSVFAIMLALSGIAMLYHGDGGATLSTRGVMLVMFSSLSYAVYIVVVNKSPLRMSSMKLTFYVLFFGMLTVLTNSFITGLHIQMLTTPRMWSCAFMLALLPTVFSLVLMTISVHETGSTPTAVMGALEPLTAVVIGVAVFGEQLTPRLAAGIVLILTAVIMIIAGKSLFQTRVFSVVSHLGHVIFKTWRWK
ncbi:MAG: EamA family transporter [Prevotella sp. AG:487_50_53]|jgi:drug/metabolite transporter (DMT)-like permease|uniref:DMT family transporter n=1 Tax=Leyella lascolaii TaxID=1776379 RepID=A0AAW7JEQ6_9BACT|nr:DMT family transporter [Leyella lascolaii]MDN0021897.1 DMT family transporter [Leyella lascolaii]MDN0024394.1 DMT family transporter [Leyella lascolaii]OKZ27410.1 MAG: EamA family transporter [Prevotella sp. AG:487_50_53]CCZ15716.1 putative membrane protein [Prevotella sp. CAG:487]